MTAAIVPPPAVPRSASSLRAAVSALTASIPCSLLDGDVSSDGSVALTGLAGRAVEPGLRRLVGGATDGAPVNLRVATFDGAFCQALDTIRPVARRFGSQAPDIQLSLKSGAGPLHDSDNIVPHFVMPDYAGYAQLSYITADGTLVHLYPSNEARQIDITAPDGRRQSLKLPGMDFRQFAAGAAVNVADPATCNCKPAEIGWQVAPPYGVDMMMITVSSQPLFSQRRPADDTSDAYLRDLQAALDAATRRGIRVNARAILVETAPR